MHAGGGVRDARQRPGTSKGFVFLSLEDETGISNVIVNPDLYEKYRVVINREKFLRVDGVLQNQDHTISIKASQVNGSDDCPIKALRERPRTRGE
jgi:error-prone DNA polymerase